MDTVLAQMVADAGVVNTIRDVVSIVAPVIGVQYGLYRSQRKALGAMSRNLWQFAAWSERNMAKLAAEQAKIAALHCQRHEGDAPLLSRIEIDPMPKFADVGEE